VGSTRYDDDLSPLFSKSEGAVMSRRQRILFIGVLAGLTAIRIAIAAAVPLADDEAYYWTWGRHLAWGYPDHPPMIAGVIHLATWVMGNTSLGVRIGPIIFALATSVVLYDLGRQMYGTLTGLVATLVLQLIPVFALGAGFAAPDGPLGFFWVLTLWFVWRATRAGHTSDWVGAGISLGLAVMSKLPAIILGLSLCGFLFSTPIARTNVRRVNFLAMPFAFIITALPTTWWIASHWALVSLRLHQSQPWIRFSNPAFNVLAFLIGQTLYYGPVTFILVLVALRQALRRSTRVEPRVALLAWSAIPLFLLTGAASVSGMAKPHWTAPAFLTALIPAAAGWLDVNRWRTQRRLILVGLGVNALVITVAFVGFFSPISPAAVAVRGWDEVASRLTVLIDQTPPAPGVFILTTEYQTASQLAFHLQERYPITTVYQDTAFAARTDLHALAEWNAVFVNNLAGGKAVPVEPFFKRVEPLPPIEVQFQGQIVQRLLVYRGYGFRGFAGWTLPVSHRWGSGAVRYRSESPDSYRSAEINR